ncbi:hypothetical protein GHT06_020087 [Daphnia sinensis]|uniref:Uncharacterized protein n=1 Tax=Daphnia sinensis TaxID=1820382 RepID=A0AAD5L3X1_9CRUS|nr:hypothetical protein GHT06_020087 [Daphnia sinensis]
MSSSAIKSDIGTAERQAEITQESLSWSNLQISQRAIGYVPYLDYSIAVYESLDSSVKTEAKKIKYFYTPVVLLDPRSAKYQYHQLIEKHTVIFDVTLWDDDIQQRVVSYLNEEMKLNADKSQINVIPFEKLILTTDVHSNAFTCPKEWKFIQMHKVVSFRLLFETEDEAIKTVELFKTSPEQLNSVFNIKFSLSNKTLNSKEIVISIESVVNGKMFSKLNQKFSKSNEIYLTADDAKALLVESVDNVILESFSDSDVVSSTSEEEIYRILERMMTSGKEIVTAQKAHMWNSVFWNDDNYRPDKIASTLNEVHLKTDKETQSKIVAAISDSSKSSLDIGTTLEGYGISSENSRFANSERERRLRKFGENCLKLEWTGDRFVPKPLELTRINLSSIRNKQVCRYFRKTRVSYFSGTLSMSVNVVQNDRITELVKKETNVVQSIQQKLDDVSKHTQQQEALDQDLVGVEDSVPSDFPWY